MYKAVIIDDEATIVQGLARLVDWEKHGCRVVGCAFDVESGIKEIKRHSPHILFTDIRMPDGDGLTMLAGLRLEHPGMQVCVLTGYRDFSYAQKALKLGVSRFLLKPSKMDELDEAISAMTDKLMRLGIYPEEESNEKAGGNSGGENAAAEENEAAALIAVEAEKFIKSRCCEKISLQDVAAACYVSQWHLSKLLGRYSGKSFYDLLNEARLEKAKELMKDPALRIGDISQMVGYSDTPHFSRIFKKIEGISANEYRNKHMG